MTVFLVAIQVIALLLLLIVIILVITIVSLTLQIRRLAVDSQHNIKAAFFEVVERIKVAVANHKKRKYRHGKIVRRKKAK